ncbi:MAG: hypothetical protein M1544_03310 [Candidatus Marsarchaeota archaeon]|nr:hypothetical protein [Candidatus Marsarchaeota archaeon]
MATISKIVRKTKDKANEDANKLSKVVGDSFGSFTSDQIKTMVFAGDMENEFQALFKEAIAARDIKNDLSRLREFSKQVEVYSDSKNHTADEVKEASIAINTFNEEAVKFIKENAREEEYKKFVYKAREWGRNPSLLYNTYMEYMKIKYDDGTGKLGKVFEKMEYSDANKSAYKLEDSDPSKDLIRKMESECMVILSARIANDISEMKNMENRNSTVSNLSKYAKEYADSLKLTDPSNIGKPLVIDKNAANSPKKFWEEMASIKLSLPLAEQIRKELENKKDYMNATDLEKRRMLLENVDKKLATDPEYLRARAYYDFMNDPAMNALIKDNIDAYTGRLQNIVNTYHKKGVKKEIVKIRKELKRSINGSAAAEAIMNIYTLGIKLGDMVNKRKGAEKEEEYNMIFSTNRDMFTKTDANGYTEFQKIAAKIIAYDELMSAFKEIVNQPKGIAIEKKKADRMEIIKELSANANNGTIFTSYLALKGLREAKQQEDQQSQGTFDFNTMGYSSGADLVAALKKLDSSKLSDAEKTDFENSLKNLEAGKYSAADSINAIKYGNKALLLQNDNLLMGGKGRATARKQILGALDSVDPTAANAQEKLLAARADFLISVLLKGSNSSLTKEVNSKLGKKAVKGLLDAYGKNFDGYKPDDWNNTNGLLKQACEVAASKGVKVYFV